MNTKIFFNYLFPSIIKIILGIFVLIPVTTYYLEPEDFGALAIINTITCIFLPLFSVGGTWILGSNYFKITENERKRLIFSVLLTEVLLRFALVAILWLASDTLLSLVIKDVNPDYITFFKIHLISLLCNVLWPTVSYLIILERRAPLHASIEIGQTLISTILTLVLLNIFEMKGVTLFIVPLITGFCSMLVELFFIRRKVLFHLSMRWFKEVWTVGTSSILANTAEAISNSADRFFIQKWISLDALGIYSHSQTYGNILKTINKSFARTINPYSLKAFSNGLDTTPVKIQIRLWVAIITCGGAIVALFSRDFLNLLTHGKFEEAAPLIVIWVFMMFSHTLGLPSFQYLLSRNATKTLSILQVGISLISLTTCAAATFFVGLLGAALAILLSNFCLQLAYILKARELGCPYEDHFFILIPFIFLAFLTVIHNIFYFSLAVRAAEASILVGVSFFYILLKLESLKKMRLNEGD